MTRKPKKKRNSTQEYVQGNSSCYSHMEQKQILFCNVSQPSLFLNSLLSHHEWTRPHLLIGYKFVMVLGPIHFQHRFSIFYAWTDRESMSLE